MIHDDVQSSKSESGTLVREEISVTEQSQNSHKVYELRVEFVYI